MPSLLLRRVRWLIVMCAWLLGGGAWAGGLTAVRAWVPATLTDNPASANAALARAEALTPRDGQFEFDAAPEQPVWYALDIAPQPGGTPLVLELTHPSIRSADLYLPGEGSTLTVLHSGRDVPPQLRLQSRFPATLMLPADAAGQTVLLRVRGTVRLHGQFLLQPRADWRRAAGWQQAAMTACLLLAALGALYALWRAVRLHSSAYALYCLLALATGISAMFITGLGEARVWPALADWRGQVSSAMSCVAAGLSMLLSERAFALDIRAPRFSRVLRVLGVGLPLAGLAALPLPLPQQQLISHFSAATAIVLGLFSVWLAWRTVNRAAAWLLLGFSPVIAGVALTTLGMSGVMAFTPWMLMAMPLGCVLELPFNLYGLHLLQQRRARVLQGLAEVAGDAGTDAGQRPVLLARLNQPPPAPAAGGSLMLLRFEGLAPGSDSLRTLDAEAVEHYLHAMLSAAVRPDNHVGRWSFHEIVLRNAHHHTTQDMRALLSALFANALRSEPFGIEPRAPQLRIACARLPVGAAVTPGALQALGQALDDPAHAGQRKVEWDLQRQQVVAGPAMSRP